MHLNNYEDRHDLLIDWILSELPQNASVLDVGANDGSFCPQVQRIACDRASFAGVDPDVAKLERHPFLTQRFYGALETSQIPDKSFNCLYAIYVLEHVQNAEAFMAAVSRVLTPGGSFFFITPNSQHYFAKIAGSLAPLGMQENVLKLLRPKQLVGRYHYPAMYRLNHPKTIERLGRRFGFDRFEFRYSERLDELTCYFPGPLKGLPWLWQQAVKATGKERFLGNLMGRLVKSTSTA
jgi:ubiquinone/menaquinone biosynthesis C-methylase UbiE